MGARESMSLSADITSLTGQALRSLGSRYPVTYVCAAALGMLTKMALHSLSSTPSNIFVENLNTFRWFEFSLVWLGILLIPALLGKSRVPDRVKENIHSLQMTLDYANIPEEQRRGYFDLLIKSLIRQISSNYQEDIAKTAPESLTNSTEVET